MKHILPRLTASLVLLATASTLTAFGHDMIAPCWRGQTGSTFQEWGFLTPANPASPELSANGYGTAVATVQPSPTADGYFADWPYSTNLGLWDLGGSGTLQVSVPNRPGASPASAKYVWVQVAQLIGGPYNVYATVSLPGATYVGGQKVLVETFDPAGPAGAIWVDQTMWRLPLNPSSETITITAPVKGSIIDQVVVDTLCLDYPPPANIVVTGDTPQGKVVSWTPVNAGCLNVTYKTNGVLAPPAGTLFPYGTTTVTQEVKDGSGAAPQTSAFTVTVGNPTLASVASFDGRWTRDRVVLSWRSVAEFWTLGYNVYVEGTEGALKRVNGALIPSSGNLLGSSYTLDDTAARSSAARVYWLEEVDDSLATSRFGPLTVAIPASASADLWARIVSSQMHSEGFEVVFLGQAGKEYEVQATADLASGDWTILTALVAGEDGQFTATDAAAPAPAQRFYRAVPR